MAIWQDNKISWITQSAEKTTEMGVLLGALLQPYDVVSLHGNLGAGKTAFARGVAHGWGTTNRVTSPTFTLVNEYPRATDGLILYHLDCYRLQSEADAITTGIEDILEAEAAVMIEWPERIKSFLTAPQLNIYLEYIDIEERRIQFGATNSRTQQIIEHYQSQQQPSSENL